MNNSSAAPTIQQHQPKKDDQKTPIPTLTYVGAPIQQKPSQPDSGPQKNRRPILGITLGVLFVLVIGSVAGGLFLFRKPGSTPSAQNTNTAERTVEGNPGPVGGTMQTTDKGLGTKIIGRWKNKTGKLEIEFKESPVGIEGFVQRVPEGWPRNRVKVGDAIFTKGKIVGDSIEGLYVNLPQYSDCPQIETRYSKCVIKFESNDTLRVTNSAWQYSFPECKWSTATYDDTWNWFRF